MSEVVTKMLPVTVQFDGNVCSVDCQFLQYVPSFGTASMVDKPGTACRLYCRAQLGMALTRYQECIDTFRISNEPQFDQTKTVPERCTFDE